MTEESKGWRKSSKSVPAGACVMVRPVSGGVEVCRSDFPAGSKLFFTIQEWEAFLDGCDLGEFDTATLLGERP
jgi:hypothetical protein